MINTIINDDALNGLKRLGDESVDCIITSPPYYQLRNYDHPNQLGLESTVDEYIKKLVDIFNEARRVLKKDGTLWIVIGDTYANNKNGITDKKINKHVRDKSITKKCGSFPRKSLMMIPSRLAIAMIDNGWILRNEIVWNKPNVIPQSVKDRFTNDFEKILFFSKSEKYYFKQQKEPMVTKDTTAPRGSKGVLGPKNNGIRKQDQLGRSDYTGFNDRYTPPQDLMRNKRTTWVIPTTPSKIAHFAMFPEPLVEIMADAGCKVGGVILDMFSGSGTTCRVAKKQNKNYIGIEINPEYVELSNQLLEDKSA